MRLVIGGYAQGKLDYVLKTYRLQECSVWDGALPDGAQYQEKPVIINHFHIWVKNCLRNGGCPEQEALSFINMHKDCVIISDEIGNGIVPMDAFEREYRERTGRILVQIAQRAEGVERVLCGIGQKIK